MKRIALMAHIHILLAFASGCVHDSGNDLEPIVNPCLGNDSPSDPADEHPASDAWPNGPTACSTAVYSWAFSETEPPWTLVGFGATEWESPASGGAVEIPDALPGDTLIVDATFSAQPSAPSGMYTALRLLAIESVATDATQTPLLGAQAIVGGGGVDASFPVAMSSVFDVTHPGQARVVVQGRVWRDGDIVRLHGAGAMRVVQVRCE